MPLYIMYLIVNGIERDWKLRVTDRSFSLFGETQLSYEIAIPFRNVNKCDMRALYAAKTLQLAESRELAVDIKDFSIEIRLEFHAPDDYISIHSIKVWWVIDIRGTE